MPTLLSLQPVESAADLVTPTASIGTPPAVKPLNPTPLTHKQNTLPSSVNQQEVGVTMGSLPVWFRRVFP